MFLVDQVFEALDVPRRGSCWTILPTSPTRGSFLWPPEGICPSWETPSCQFGNCRERYHMTGMSGSFLLSITECNGNWESALVENGTIDFVAITFGKGEIRNGQNRNSVHRAHLIYVIEAKALSGITITVSLGSDCHWAISSTLTGMGKCHPFSQGWKDKSVRDWQTAVQESETGTQGRQPDTRRTALGTLIDRAAMT